MKPVIKWAGGKARLAENIEKAFARKCSGTYYEPFLGSCAVFLYRRAHGMVDKAVLADANPKLINVHRAVRDDVEKLLSTIDDMPSEEYRDAYYDMRDAYNDGPHTGTLAAARFIWLNRAGFNGLYRENRKGKFNVPVGRYARLNFPSRERFLEVSSLLKGAELVAADFRVILDEASDGDQVYCDPPYVPLTETASFTGYHKSPFGIEEQKALALASRKAAIKGARVVLSNHDLPVVRHILYPVHAGFEHVAKPRVARAISRKAASRKKVTEVIARIGPLRVVA